jgi:hypothetical protein
VVKVFSLCSLQIISCHRKKNETLTDYLGKLNQDIASFKEMWPLTTVDTTQSSSESLWRGGTWTKPVPSNGEGLMSGSSRLQVATSIQRHESELPLETLKSFKGVVVSDFMPSMTPSVPTTSNHPSGEDLNEELLKDPYDEELKALLKNSVNFQNCRGSRPPRSQETLREALRAVNKAHRKVVRRDQSSAVLACCDRFEKNRKLSRF